MSDTEVESFWEGMRPPREQHLISVQPAEYKPVTFEVSISGVDGAAAELSSLRVFSYQVTDPPYAPQVHQGFNPDTSMGVPVPREVEQNLREAVLAVVHLRGVLFDLGIRYDYDCSDIRDRIIRKAVEAGLPATYYHDIAYESIEVDEL